MDRIWNLFLFVFTLNIVAKENKTVKKLCFREGEGRFRLASLSFSVRWNDQVKLVVAMLWIR